MTTTQTTILVIDDEKANLGVISAVLGQTGLKILTARNGETALKRAALSQPDLILLDVMLPDLDGYEVCRRLKAEEATRRIPVIFLTVLDSVEDKVRGFEAGGVDYLVKPIQEAELLARINTHLALRTLQEQLKQLVEARTAELRQTNALLRQEIQERRQVEEALRLEEQQYHDLADSMSDGLAIVQQRRFLFVNRALTVMFDCPAEEFIARHGANLLTCVRQSAYERQLQELLNQEIPSFFRQEQCRAANGTALWLEIFHSRILWQGRPAALLTIRDVTAEKAREAVMREKWNQLKQENLALKNTLHDRYKFGDIIGKSRAMQVVYQSLVNAAASEAHIVIYGESGTGKELVARTIHQQSQRRDRAFIPVNCSAIPENLFESEFFGYRKGAFTGAHRDKPGVFDLAEGGTVFLDEIGELSPGLQAKLLRVIEGGGYTALGGRQRKQANSRIIAAGSRHLTDLVRQGRIREDFFYRIHVLEINLPPLRDRKEDIPLLIDYFLQHFGDPRTFSTLPGAVGEAFCAYHWPGNVRELQNELQRYLAGQHLKFLGVLQPPSDSLRALTEAAPEIPGLSLRDALDQFEKTLIIHALRQHDGNIARAAAALDLPLRTLYRKINAHQLE